MEEINKQLARISQNLLEEKQKAFDKEVKKAGGVFSLIVKLKNGYGNYELK